MIAIARLPGTRVVRASRNYVSAPVGATTPQPDYVNAAIALHTTLAPRALLRFLLAIERRQQRRPHQAQEEDSHRFLQISGKCHFVMGV